jgi:uncharacterized LabA/DUF88 family protein
MRIAFVVDGFNLYHSIRDAERQIAARPQRWLDLRALCQDYVRQFGRSATLAGIYYFSALAKHLEATKPDVSVRHQSYIDAIRSTGVEVTLANFKEQEKFIPMKFCRFRLHPFRRLFRVPLPGGTVVIRRAEEKETNVAIASKLFELLHTGVADVIVLVSGDTDLLPAIRTAQKLFPSALVAILFPFKRHNAELKRAVTRSYKIRKEQYARFQLPDPVILPGGRSVSKPGRW